MLRVQTAVFGGLLSLSFGASGQTEMPTGAASNEEPPRRFVIVTEAEAQSPAFGMLMICPSHAHGTPDEAEMKLRAMLAPVMPQPSTVWVCRGNQIETLRRFAPLVQRVVVNPFGGHLPAGQEPILHGWCCHRHPVLEMLAGVRQAAGSTQTLACIDLEGEPVLFRSRKPCFEEIEWMALASIGANYQGIVWRGDPEAVPFARQLRRLSTDLQRIGRELAQTRCVNWIRRSDGQPARALLSSQYLLLVALSRQYMPAAPPGRGVAGPSLPIDPQTETAELALDLPAGWSIASAESYRGRQVKAEQAAGLSMVRWVFRGGGDVLVCRLARAERASDLSSDHEGL